MTQGTRKKLGTILLAVGVTAWVPYLLLEFALGREVIMYPFLAVHLSGVIPGAVLRRWDFLLSVGHKLQG